MGIKQLDNFLHSITMYKLVLYGLLVVAATAIVLSAADMLPFDISRLAISAGLLLGVCYGANILLARLFGAVHNSESALITAMILFCIFSPPSTVRHILLLALVAILAMVSKYVLAWRQRHLFNPAAIAAVIVSLLGLTSASWWIGTGAMLPVVAVFGALVLRKIHRGWLFAAFALPAFLIIMLTSAGNGITPLHTATQALTVWPLVFFGTIMLTEPLTTPPTHRLRLVYGALVGVAFASGWQVGPVFATPEIALILGNVFAFLVGPRQRIVLKLRHIRELGTHILAFSFVPQRPFRFHAGQYLEMTLPHAHTDLRGNRRFFTIASSPAEEEVLITIKYNEPSSSFKQHLRILKPGDTVSVTHIAGDFTLPADPEQKLLFIAGGIGITPFRSMLHELLDHSQRRDIVLLYAAADLSQLVFQDVLEAAAAYGVTVVNILATAPPKWSGVTGTITSELITAAVPDARERIAYLSGPPAMVDAHKATLKHLGVRHIRTDYFAGY